MKATTALITINGKVTLKVLLHPETQEELDFLEDAIEKDPEFALSFESRLTDAGDV